MPAITLKIFVSSPGDVGQERMIASRVIDRLQGEFSGYVELQPILWEHEPLRATAHFQQQITAPSSADIVVCILWSRLGTRLPDQFEREDGTHYASGTEWEFEDAARAFRETGKPDLLVYRKLNDPLIDFHDEKVGQERLAQKKALDSFIDRWFGNPGDGFKAAFHGFDNPDDFESTLDVHLRALIRERLPDRLTDENSTKIPILWFKGTPYRGLEAFDFDHAPVYFGRTRAISAIKESLVRQASAGCAFVLILGMSGGGKSSLVRAGVLPTIMNPGVIEGIELWRRCSFRPSDTAGDLLEGLASALVKDFALPELISGGSSAEELATLLHTNPDAALVLLNGAMFRAAECEQKEQQLSDMPETRLAIFIDQMEEIFTRKGVDDQERKKFVEVLELFARSGMIWVMATMRSDFYPRCAEIPTLVTMKDGAGQYDLLPPTFAEIGQMIRYPSRAAGVSFEINPQTREGLDDVLHQAASQDPEALPLLEFTLDELFRQKTEDNVLTFAAYENLGGLEGALARRAEEVYGELDPVVKLALPSVLHALVTVNGSDLTPTSRRVPLASISATPDRKALVEAFIAARLLVTDRAVDGSAVVTIAHEALLHNWPRLRRLLEDDQDFLRTRDRVAGSAMRWDQESKRHDLLLPEGKLLTEAESLLSRRPELDTVLADYIVASKRAVVRARQMRTRTFFGIAGAFFTVVSGFGIFSYGQWKTAAHQRDMAVAYSKKLTYDIPNRLIDLPGSRPVLKAIFEENAGMLDQVSGDKAESEEAVNFRYMGDMWLMLGDVRKAQDAYDKGFALSEKLAKLTPTSATTWDLAVSYAKIGDVKFQVKNYVAAQSAYQQSIDLLNRLPAGAVNSKNQHDLSASYEKIGDVRLTLNDPAGALKAYTQDLAIAEKIALDPNNTHGQQDLSVSYTKMGDVQLALNHMPEALTNYRKSLALLQKLPGSDSNLGIQRSISVSLTKIGDVQMVQSDLKGALASYLAGLEIARTLSYDKTNAQAQHDLSVAYTKVGNIYMALNDTAQALTSFESSLKLLRELTKDKENAQAQADLAYVEQIVESLRQSPTKPAGN